MHPPWVHWSSVSVVSVKQTRPEDAIDVDCNGSMTWEAGGATRVLLTADRPTDSYSFRWFLRVFFSRMSEVFHTVQMWQNLTESIVILVFSLSDFEP